MDVTVNVPALEKLLDIAASGIGAVASALGAPAAAHLHGRAAVTSARYRGDVLRLEAQAQTDSRKLLMPDETSEVQGELVIGEVVRQKVEYQQAKRVRNIQDVMLRAAEELRDGIVPDDPVDHDWAARFFNEVQDISSEQMQILWARLLAGQARNPGSVSVRTLSVLKNLDQDTAELFRVLCSVSVHIVGSEEPIVDARVPTLGKSAGTNGLSPYGFPTLSRQVD